MIHVVVMKRLIGLLLLIHIELLRRSQSFKNRGVGVGTFVYRLHSPVLECGYRSKHHVLLTLSLRNDF
jgi:hypothetical protein